MFYFKVLGILAALLVAFFFFARAHDARLEASRTPEQKQARQQAASEKQARRDEQARIKAANVRYTGFLLNSYPSSPSSRCISDLGITDCFETTAATRCVYRTKNGGKFTRYVPARAECPIVTEF